MPSYEAHVLSDGSCEARPRDDDGPTISWPSIDALAQAWVADTRARDLTPAQEFLYDLARTAPVHVVDLLVRIACATQGDEYALACLGSGPIEDLVKDHGERFVDELVVAAGHEPLFASAVRCMWLSERDSPTVRHRLAQIGARDFVAEHAMTPEERAAYFAERDAKGWIPE